jgi:hypothetical protein
MPRCRVCKELSSDVRYGVCFDCAESQEETRNPLEAIDAAIQHRADFGEGSRAVDDFEAGEGRN